MADPLEGLARLGNDGGHFGWTDRRFVRLWIAPVIRRQLAETIADGNWRDSRQNGLESGIATGNQEF